MRNKLKSIRIIIAITFICIIASIIGPIYYLNRVIYSKTKKTFKETYQGARHSFVKYVKQIKYHIDILKGK